MLFFCLVSLGLICITFINKLFVFFRTKKTVYFIENEEIVRLTRSEMEFFTVDEEPIEKLPVRIDWDINAAEKSGYEHFMLKEINEQPTAIRTTIAPRI